MTSNPFESADLDPNEPSSPVLDERITAQYSKIALSFLLSFKMLEQELGREKMLRTAKDTLTLLFSVLTDAYETMGGDGPALIQHFVGMDKDYRDSYPEVEKEKETLKKKLKRVAEPQELTPEELDAKARDSEFS